MVCCSVHVLQSNSVMDGGGWRRLIVFSEKLLKAGRPKRLKRVPGRVICYPLRSDLEGIAGVNDRFERRLSLPTY